MKVLRPLTKNITLRNWQSEFLQMYFEKLQKDFLLVSAPSTGKTLAALLVAYNLLMAGLIKRIVIVVPTDHLKIQWAEAAAYLGIDLDPFWTNSSGREAADYLGVIVTYSQVCNAPDIYDFNCLDAETFVIFDEIHHSADLLAWGMKLLAAFVNAAFRLSLSGTPFRNDDNQIPFVRYEDRRCQADYVYGYGRALADGVCSPIFFPSFAGDVAWIRGNGEEVSCSMLDSLSRQKSAERLNAILDASGEWVPSVLRKADQTLTMMRLARHSDAAGLVFCKDQYHARQIASLLKVITNEEPAVVISDETNASRMIRDFAKPGNPKRWIVAVRMISEGVDIPRLRVGVYATTVTSELFFRQVVGRFTRFILGLSEPHEQSAALYLPSEEILIEYALRIKSEREHYLADKPDTSGNHQLAPLNEKCAGSAAVLPDNRQSADGLDYRLEDIVSPAGNTAEDEEESLSGEVNPGCTTDGYAYLSRVPDKPRNFIIPLSSQARAHDTIFDGYSFSPGELRAAELLGREIGASLSPAQVAVIVRTVVCATSETENKPSQPAGFKNAGSESFDDRNASAAETISSAGLKSSVQNIDPANDGDNFDSSAIESSVQPKSPGFAETARRDILSEYIAEIDNEESNLSCLTLAERKKKLKQTIKRLANHLARLTCADYDEIHRRWIREMHGMRSVEATETDLLKKIDWIKNQLSEFYRRRSSVS